MWTHAKDGFKSATGNSRADLLVDGLLEVVVVDDGADLSVAVGRPVRRRHLRPRLARVHAVPLLLVHAGESRLPLLSGKETSRAISQGLLS